MTNLEGIAKQLLNNNISDRKIVNQLMAEYRVFKKDYPKARLLKMAEGVLQESKKSLSAHSNPLIKNDKLLSTLLNIPKAGVSMGEGGVGCRGKGDFFVHELLTKISKTSVDPLISPESLDDTGAVEVPFGSNAAQLEKTGTRDMKGEKAIILTKMEGMH
ncbi:MAG TPA: hypothetical protein VKO42_03390, partial [Patescibacteria group bacterium]|nr:hypothetical protein [Patescibacteria group bacterium]